MKGIEGWVDEKVLANYITGAVQAGIQNAVSFLLEDLCDKAKLDYVIENIFKDRCSPDGSGACSGSAPEGKAADTNADVCKTWQPIATAPNWVKDTIREKRTRGGVSLKGIRSILAKGGFPTTDWLLRRWCDENGLQRMRFPTGEGRKSHAIASWPMDVQMATYEKWRAGEPNGKIRATLAAQGYKVASDVINRHCNYMGRVACDKQSCMSPLPHAEHATTYQQTRRARRPLEWTNLSLFREKEKLTQDDLSQIVQVSSGLISKIERRQAVTLTPQASANFKSLIGPHCTLEWMQSVVPCARQSRLR